jgi:hypothetical protein
LSWLTVWACDFVQLYDIYFRPLFAFFVMDVNTKQVLHVAVTRRHQLELRGYDCAT